MEREADEEKQKRKEVKREEWGSQSESDSLKVRAGGKGLLRVRTPGADWR